MPRVFTAIWGNAAAAVEGRRRFRWVDALVLLGIAGIAIGIFRTAQEWAGPLRHAVEIDLSPAALPKYTLLSLSRGLIAYVLSLGFTLVYGYWAAHDRLAERALIPLLDMLQSIPVLGFMPGLVLALVALFPRSNVGLELAAVLMIFTGQAWNMTFSYYRSLKSVPNDHREVAQVYRFNAWHRLRWVELPFATIGLVWNSMMSMAGGWFFLMISEAFVLGDKDFRLPGLGSYMSVAVAQGNVSAMAWAVFAMVAMIVALDQVLWRPVVVWAQKFRVEEGGREEEMRSWLLEWLRRSGLLRWAGAQLRRASHAIGQRVGAVVQRPSIERVPIRKATGFLSAGLFGALILGMLYGVVRLVLILRAVPAASWSHLLVAASLTLGRVLLSTALGTLWALPAGLAIGLSSRLSRLLQPFIQVVASFPTPMLFPVVIAALGVAGVPLGWGSVMLLLLGTQWYILFNVIAGAMAIPSDLREAARTYRFGRWHRFHLLYFPAVFPYLVTGWITAAGGAWNASIVAEYVTFRGQTIATTGLGAQISEAAAKGNIPLLAASVLVMSIVVVAFNRSVWRRLHGLAETRFSLSK